MVAVEAICRQFLWSGDVGSSKRSLVAWSDICRTRAMGGLGLIHLPSWNKIFAPRSKFVLWMACWDRLATKDRLINMQINVDPQCVFCSNAPEDIDHLLFVCPCIKPTWTALLQWCGYCSSGNNWQEVKQFLCAQTRGKTPKARFLETVVTEFIYLLWRERNSRVFLQKTGDISSLLCESVRRAVGRCLRNLKMNNFCWSISDYPRIRT